MDMNVGFRTARLIMVAKLNVAFFFFYKFALLRGGSIPNKSRGPYVHQAPHLGDRIRYIRFWISPDLCIGKHYVCRRPLP